MYDEDGNEIIDDSTGGFTGGEGSGNWWEDYGYSSDPGTGSGSGTTADEIDAAENARYLQMYKDLGLLADDATDFSALNQPTAYLPGGGTMSAADLAVLRESQSSLSGLPKLALDKLKSMFTDPKTGAVNWRQVGAAATGLTGLLGATGLGGSGLSKLLSSLSNPRTTTTPTGYQGGIPSYTAVRQAVPNTYDPTRRPGSGGLRYFTDTTYAKPDDLAAAQAAAQTQATGLAALNASNPARQAIPAAAGSGTPTESNQVLSTTGSAPSDVIKKLPVPTYAKGGDVGRYLGGPTDGMADKLSASIEGEQEAKLSHGEFILPADIVSHLGNGNSDAGAQRLYDMMAKIRKARTGTTKQGKQIRPEKYLPV